MSLLSRVLTTYFRRSFALSILGGLAAGCGLGLTVLSVEYGVVPKFLEAAAHHYGVKPNVFIPAEKELRKLGTAGAVQYLGLMSTGVIFVLVGSVLDVVRRALRRGKSFDRSLPGAAWKSITDILFWGIPLIACLFVTTSLISLEMYTSGDLGAPLMRQLIFQTLTITPMLVCYEIAISSVTS